MSSGLHRLKRFPNPKKVSSASTKAPKSLPSGAPTSPNKKPGPPASSGVSNRFELLLYSSRLTSNDPLSSRGPRASVLHVGVTFLSFVSNSFLDASCPRGKIISLTTAPRLIRGVLFLVAQALLPVLFLFLPFQQIPKLNSKGDFHVLSQQKGPCIPVFLHLLRRPPLPHPAHLQPSPPLPLPRPKRSPIPRHPKSQQRAGLLLLRQLPRRLRSQHRPVPHHPRCHPRRCKTQNRSHRRLSRANPPAVHPRFPARIHQRLWHRLLARRRPRLCQVRPRLPLPTQARPRSQTHPALRSAIQPNRSLAFRSCNLNRRDRARPISSSTPRPSHPRRANHRQGPLTNNLPGHQPSSTHSRNPTCFTAYPSPDSQQPIADHPSDSATNLRPKNRRPALRPQLPSHHRRQTLGRPTPLKSTLPSRPRNC